MLRSPSSIPLQILQLTFLNTSLVPKYWSSCQPDFSYSFIGRSDNSRQYGSWQRCCLGRNVHSRTQTKKRGKKDGKNGCIYTFWNNLVIRYLILQGKTAAGRFLVNEDDASLKIEETQKSIEGEEIEYDSDDERDMFSSLPTFKDENSNKLQYDLFSSRRNSLIF